MNFFTTEDTEEKEELQQPLGHRDVSTTMVYYMCWSEDLEYGAHSITVGCSAREGGVAVATSAIVIIQRAWCYAAAHNERVSAVDVETYALESDRLRTGLCCRAMRNNA